MRDTLTQPNPSPRLASKPVGALLEHFATALPWLTDRYGLVQTGVEKDGKGLYPQVYRNDGTAFTTDVRPDESMKALCWFERDGPSLFEPDGSVNLTGMWRHQLAVVVWLNLKLIAPTLTHDYAEELAEDFLARGLLDSPLGGDLMPERIEFQAERVFERYRWSPVTHQLLMYPFSGFRIPFEVLQRFAKCAPAFGSDGQQVGFPYELSFALS